MNQRQLRVQTQVRAGFPCKVWTPANRACIGTCSAKYPIKSRNWTAYNECAGECNKTHPYVWSNCEE